jgi:hypothetical protein
MKKIIIKHTDLKGIVKKRKGILGLNTGRVGCTAPWGRLQDVSLATINSDQRPFTGQTTPLLIRQGGIHDENLSRHYKTIFREDVFPAIKNFAPDCGNIFSLTLHFNNDLLMMIEME